MASPCCLSSTPTPAMGCPLALHLSPGRRHRGARNGIPVLPVQDALLLQGSWRAGVLQSKHPQALR
eukprot:11191369-Lingulodinium_polyedra.AAC.1